MKTTTKAVIIGVALCFASTIETFAIEGLKLSLQCSNVVLSWPSIEYRNYIVQYRPTLDPSTPWQTLTSSFPADLGTNVTFFIHSNIVQNPNCGGSGSFAAMFTGGEQTDSEAAVSSLNSQPMAIPADGSGSAVPLALYPPGFDLSNLLIFDPLTEEWLSGAGYTRLDLGGISLNGIDPNDPGDPQEGPGVSGSGPETGFYQVVQDGVQILNSSITNLTNGVLSATVTVGFEAGNADPYNGTNLVGTLNSAVLLVDGEKFPGDTTLDAPPGYPWRFSADTAFLENGDHTLQVQVFWFDPFGNTDGTESVFPSRYSDPVTITVSNAVYYPQWEEDIGEAATNAAYFLKTTCTNADWTIDIYDVGSNFVQRLSGHTDDGIIEANWNLIDTNGVARTNANVDPEFSAIATVADPITKPTPKKKHPKSDWPEHGKWTVAFLDYFKHYYSANNDMQGHINGFALTAGAYGGYFLYYPPGGSTNDIGQTYPLRYYNPQHTNEVVTATQIAKDSAMLKSFLGSTNSRNVFYRGHGGPQQIGYVSAKEIGKVVKHRYRFVLLQACNTADGGLDRAFGIKGPGQYDLAYYQKSGNRPASFMGNHGESRFANGGHVNIGGVDYDGTIPWQVPYLYYNFLFYWDDALMGWDLFSAMGQAMLDLPPIQGWSSSDQPGQKLKIFGYPFLHIDQFNYRTDWP